LISLVEHQATELPRDALTEVQGLLLQHTYSRVISLDFPHAGNNHQWRLTPKGYVGFIPLGKQQIQIKPKVSLANLFRMLESAFDLVDFRDDLVMMGDIDDLFSSLAKILSDRVHELAKRGIERRYLSIQEPLTTMRGRLLVNERSRRSWMVELPCDFQEHTSDIAENQIIAWTLSRILRSGICRADVYPSVQAAFRSLLPFCEVKSVPIVEFDDFIYDRLNFSYQSIHALCRLFLELAGPTHEIGDRSMLPFLVDMNRLFERFVSAWLKANLPSDFIVETKRPMTFSEIHDLRYQADIVLFRRGSNKPLAVIDTKYKAAGLPESGDVHQIIHYAMMLNTARAFLVYPQTIARKLDEKSGGIRLQNVAFDLSQILDSAGNALCTQLLADIGTDA
jgi:5-methylcytosine-specific restriction enzyme subunit McrC